MTGEPDSEAREVRPPEQPGRGRQERHRPALHPHQVTHYLHYLQYLIYLKYLEYQQLIINTVCARGGRGIAFDSFVTPACLPAPDLKLKR